MATPGRARQKSKRGATSTIVWPSDLTQDVTALSEDAGAKLAAFATAWLEMSTSSPPASRVQAVCSLAERAALEDDGPGSNTTQVIGILGRTLLVPGTKPLHQPIQALLRRLPDTPWTGAQLSELLHSACSADSLEKGTTQAAPGSRSGLPAALVSCLGSSALTSHLRLQATDLLPALCAIIEHALPVAQDQGPSRLTQDQLEDLLDSISGLHGVLTAAASSEPLPLHLLLCTSATLHAVLCSSMALREVLSSAATAMLTTLRAVLPSKAATALHWAQALQLGAQRSLAEPGDLVSASELEAWRQLEEFRADLAARLTPMSRICACRGVIEAAPPGVLSADLSSSAAPKAHAWQLLVHGALPFFIDAVQTAQDAPFRYVAVTALSAGLARLKKVWQCLQAENGQAVDCPRPALLAKDILEHLLAVLWPCWEDPMRQVAKEAHATFAVLLDILELQSAREGTVVGDFLDQVAVELLNQGAGHKGRYAPLAAIAPRLGYHRILALRPPLVLESLAQLGNNRLCTSVCGLLRALWTAASHDPEASWVPGTVQDTSTALIDGPDALRANLAAHVLPLLFGIHPGACAALLAALDSQGAGAPATPDLQSARMAVLAAGHASGLVTWEKAASGVTPEQLHAHVFAALQARNGEQRLAAASLVCTHPKALAPFTPRELGLVQLWAELEMVCDSTPHREKVLRLLSKAGARVRGLAAAARQRGDRAELQRLASAITQLYDLAVARVRPFMPHGTKIMSLRLVQQLLAEFQELWRPEVVESLPSNGSRAQSKPLDVAGFDPFGPQRMKEATMQLVNASIDSWDDVRWAAMTCLRLLPSPLPGYEEEQPAARLLDLAFGFGLSDNEAEAESGAMLLGVLLSKEDWAPTFAPCGSQNLNTSSIQGRTLQEARRRLDLAKTNLDEAWDRGFMLQPFLILRHLVPELPWSKMAATGNASLRSDLLSTASCIHQLIIEALAITLQILAKPQEYGVDAEGVLEGDPLTDGENVEWDAEASRPQLVTRMAWGSCREAALLWMTLADSLPLPGAADPGLQAAGVALLLDVGARLVQQLTLLKHNGAIEKCSQALSAVCTRVLASGVKELDVAPLAWLDAFLAFLSRPGQGRSDIVRRSAGLPAGILAVLAAGSSGTWREVLISHTLPRLIALAHPETESTADWAPRVHALNTLRMLFSASELADGTARLLPQGVGACLAGLSASRWEIRNAATLAYAALLTRVLGFRNDAVQEAAGARRGVTARDFFLRFPTLHPLLLQHAEDSAAALGKGSDLHASTFPVLVLLSRLRPDTEDGVPSPTAENEPRSPAAFLPAVAAFGAAAPLAVRELAARATLPLLPAHGRGDAAAALANQLLAGVDGRTAGLNQCHGWMLQLGAILPVALEGRIVDQRMPWLEAVLAAIR
ncbi:hypothetical protein ACKKBG_A11425 [Auxenochlorella protothecoides x Auxenochlorella symbiontica]